jgi:hypothetical protein
MFYTGQKVVCINDKNFTYIVPNGVYPKLKNVYTIAVYVRSGLIDFVALHEFPPVNGLDTLWFAARFRPLCNRPTDISIFKEALKPVNVKEKACNSFKEQLELYRQAWKDWSNVSFRCIRKSHSKDELT